LVSVLKDLQIVNIALRVLHRPDARMLPSMYRQLGIDYDERVLPSICNEVSVMDFVCIHAALWHFSSILFFCAFVINIWLNMS